MIFNIDTTTTVPIYSQIIEQVKRGIAARTLRPGDALPSLREMSAHLRINPLTVTRAYRELETSGIVVTEHGRGTYISQTQDTGTEYRHALLESSVDKMLLEANYLGYTPDEVRAVVNERLRALHEVSDGVTEKGAGSDE